MAVPGADMGHVDASRAGRAGADGAPADRGGVILGWLVKLVVVLGVLGVAAFDGLSVVATRLSLADTGAIAARAASTEWSHDHDVQAAFDAAWASARQEDERNRVETDTFVIRPDATVHLVVDRHARTLLLEHLGPVAHWADVHVAASGRGAL
jgi:hypothetical protein